jgi:hypothetical protein
LLIGLTGISAELQAKGCLQNCLPAATSTEWWLQALAKQACQTTLCGWRCALFVACPSYCQLALAVDLVNRLHDRAHTLCALLYQCACLPHQRSPVTVLCVLQPRHGEGGSSAALTRKGSLAGKGAPKIHLLDEAEQQEMQEVLQRSLKAKGHG